MDSWTGRDRVDRREGDKIPRRATPHDAGNEGALVIGSNGEAANA
jgi:hypothetical protein